MRETLAAVIMLAVLLLLFEPKSFGRIAAQVEHGYHEARDKLYGAPGTNKIIEGE